MTDLYHGPKRDIENIVVEYLCVAEDDNMLDKIETYFNEYLECIKESTLLLMSAGLDIPDAYRQFLHSGYKMLDAAKSYALDLLGQSMMYVKSENEDPSFGDRLRSVLDEYKYSEEKSILLDVLKINADEIREGISGLFDEETMSGLIYKLNKGQYDMVLE